MKEKMTAVNWLINELHKKQDHLNNVVSYNHLFDKAREMEKQQIMDAYADGKISVITNETISYEDYYNKTFQK